MISLLAAALLLASPAAPAQLSFPVTGSAECQVQFTAGMLALHSFMYEDAHDAFRAAIKADPACEMARWGDAFAYVHPLWGEEDLPAARLALAALDDSRLSDRERGYVAGVRLLVADGPRDANERAWLEAAEALHARYPDDDETALHEALALLTVADDQDVRLSMRAAALAQDVFARNPRHPGAAHLLIHAFDSPDHAVLGLPAARRYAAIAPAASHALHMPAHIFVQLGLWRDVLASNVAAWAANEAEAKRRKTLDRDWHTFDWIAAADLELGQTHRAEAALDLLRELVEKHPLDTDARSAYGALVRAYVMQTDRWDQLDALLAPVARPALDKLEAGPRARELQSQINLAYFRALPAVRKGDEVAVTRALASVDSLLAALEQRRSQATARARAAGLRGAYLAAARAMHAPSDASIAEARRALDHAAAHDALSGPVFAAPTHEVCGQLLLALGRPKDALAEFEAALDQHPNHAASLLGAGRAARAAGDATTAKHHFGLLASQWAEADPSPVVTEVHLGAGATESPAASANAVETTSLKP